MYMEGNCRRRKNYVLCLVTVTTNFVSSSHTTSSTENKTKLCTTHQNCQWSLHNIHNSKTYHYSLIKPSRDKALECSLCITKYQNLYRYLDGTVGEGVYSCMNELSCYEQCMEIERPSLGWAQVLFY